MTSDQAANASSSEAAPVSWCERLMTLGWGTIREWSKERLTPLSAEHF